MIKLDRLNTIGNFSEIKKGQLLVIQRKQDNRKILVKCVDKTNENEIILSKGKNDYFNFDMYMEGKSWVWSVWSLPIDVEITSVTNNMMEFPR